MKLFFLIILIAFSAWSFSGKLYFFLIPHVGVSWSYIVDQSLPIIISCFIVFIFFRKEISRKKILEFLKYHRTNIIVITLVAFIAHGWVLRYYFFSEDISTVLREANSGGRDFAFFPLNNGYPLLPFIFSLVFFKTYSTGYNILSLLCFLFAAYSLYCFINIFSKKRILALVGTLFFVATPAYIDMFSWQASVQGMSLVLGLSLLSLIFLEFFTSSLQYNHLFISLLFFASALKTGFVRTAGILFIYLFLLVFPKKRFTKNALLQSVIAGGVYLTVWLSFLYIRFIRNPIDIINTISSSGTGDKASYISHLSYYSAHLIVPSKIGVTFFNFFKSNLLSYFISTYFNGSSSYFLGFSFLLIITGITIVSIFKKFKSKRYLLLGTIFVFANLFYVPAFVVGATNISLFDNFFIRSVPPYGPGSRYVFFSSVGVGILISFFFYKVYRKKKLLASAIFLPLLFFYALFSMQGHMKIVKSISDPDREFFDKLFSLVPLNREPKLIFSINPQQNSIDQKPKGYEWLHGFYKPNELFYTKDWKQLLSLSLSGKFKKENIFAIYTNPETNSFTDISEEVKDEIFNDKEKKRQNVAVAFPSPTAKSTFSKVTSMGPFFHNRPIFVSKDMNKRFLFLKTLSFKLLVQKNLSSRFPFSESLVMEKQREIPGELWNVLRKNRPRVFKHTPGVLVYTLSSFDYAKYQDIDISKRIEMTKILKRREELQSGIQVTVSGIYKDDFHSSASALVDGSLISDPKPRDDESFYQAEKTPTTIDLQLPYQIVLGRMLFNIPKIYKTEYSPTELSIQASEDGFSFKEVGTLKESFIATSGNGGKLIVVNLLPERAKFIKIVVTKTSLLPVVIDEITIDDKDALAFTPDQLSEYGATSFYYVDNELLLNNLTLNSYNTLSFLYSCAEDIDWKKQQSTQNPITNVWTEFSIPIENVGSWDEIKVPIDCRGSKLRQLIFIGPPYPSEVAIKDAKLQ